MWDLGGVLLTTSRSAARHIGLWDCMVYTIFQFKNPARLKKKFFEILNLTRAHEPQNNIITAEKDIFMPNIMCEFEAGLITSTDLLEEVNKTIKTVAEDGYFSSKREQRILERIIQTVFNPELFAQLTKPVPQAIDIIKLCSEKLSSTGKPVHQMVILSNWDAASFQNLKTSSHCLPLFKYFDEKNIFISGKYRNKSMLKPHQSAFMNVITTLQIDAAECIFIDDQEPNIKAARACGIYAIQLKKNNYDQLKKDLKKIGIF